jgi:hypothetical protein
MFSDNFSVSHLNPDYSDSPHLCCGESSGAVAKRVMVTKL